MLSNFLFFITVDDNSNKNFWNQNLSLALEEKNVLVWSLLW